VNTNGYVYAKDISKKLSLIETFEDGKQKTHKLKQGTNYKKKIFFFFPGSGRHVVALFFSSFCVYRMFFFAGPNTIGRSASNTIRVTCDKYISRSHCKIEVIHNVPFISDLGKKISDVF
jgi:adenine-specific DNA methylase